MKPSIPRGTRDFGPAEMQKRQYIFNIVKANFQLFGYAPIETPCMENIGTLTGKYGEEGDQLIFKVLNSRIHESKDDKKDLLRKEFETSLEKSYNSEHLTEKALRYDLTVPFARYVVMNNHAITYPFKRYQIQPVWRADKPQKGRYREFYQCDADVIGSNSLINELELIAMMDKSFAELNIPVLVKINNRKILAGIAEVIGAPERMIDIAIAIDKYDKIGLEGVEKELLDKGFSNHQISILNDALFMHNNKIVYGDKALKDDHNKTRLNFLKNGSDYRNSVTFQKGIEELEFIFNNLKSLGIKHISIELDITLARGLNYYTGTIFEAKANAGTFTPSILGGGRYDDLTGIFGLKGLSGVGISFGIDRIYDVMEELNLFPESVNKVSTTKILLANFGEAELMHCVGLVSKLRAAGINAEVYPDAVKKIAKQFEYADKKQIPFVGVVGGNEMANNTVMLKNMTTGTQEEVNFEKLVEALK
ncbi:MAG TPA: histidine--tRNA ligase [Bacteroidia bacterium]|nr:histidine--tRNA ligase [Bacteroidia bacterium]